MKIAKAPKVGWGILEPDPEVSPETLQVVEQFLALPNGQRDALLSRAVPTYLYLEQRLDRGHEPDASQMVRCSSALSNFLLDILGR